MAVESRELAVVSGDGHRSILLARLPRAPSRSLLWLPALGVAARHYLPFVEALAERGIAVFVHEWRGHGSSNLRAARDVDWGYRELLTFDLPASEAVVANKMRGVPRIVGGHSLGGQLACCRLAMAGDAASTLWLVASGSPYWRSFPLRHRLGLPLAYRFLPWLARMRGALPGRTVGFGGNEARSLINDWARSGLSGRYAAATLDIDLETALAQVRVAARAVLFRDDWLAPLSSLRYLLDKMAPREESIVSLDASAAGTHADHFAWMRHPAGVADVLAAADRSA